MVYNILLQRSLVLNYLCHHCYTRTAAAFAKDSTVQHLDPDGDEILQPKVRGILVDQDILELNKETLREAELRNSTQLNVLVSPSFTVAHGYQIHTQEFVSRYFLGKSMTPSTYSMNISHLSLLPRIWTLLPRLPRHWRL